MTAILLLLALFLPPQADPFATAKDKPTLQKQVSDLQKMRARKNNLTPAELTQERKVRQAIGQKTNQIRDVDRAAFKAQFLKEHPECVKTCVPDKRGK